VNIKGLVSETRLFREMVALLARKVKEITSCDFVAGNVTGGMIPGWLLSEMIGVPFVYVRDVRKKGGHKELITGDIQKKLQGKTGIVTEELVNFAETIVNSANELRAKGYKVTHGATILSCHNPYALKSLKENNIDLIYLLTLSELFEIAKNMFERRLIEDYKDFFKNPLKWQEERGFKPVSSGGTK
jgi:orotate phosphoribosyltransferase